VRDGQGDELVAGHGGIHYGSNLPKRGSTITDARPFPDDEYRARGARVRGEMARRGLDVLVVTSPPNLLYLTGYAAIWYPWRLPLGVAVVREPASLVFFDWTRHEGYARLHAFFDELVLMEYAGAPGTVATALAERGLAGATVGLERWGQTPAAPILDAVADALRAGGASVAEGDWIVDGVRLAKSPAEVQRIRRAAAMADAAVAGLREELRPGMSELDVAARLIALLVEAGSELAACNPLVSSGPTAWCDNHAAPSHRRLTDGDVVSVDVCGVVDGYHANLSRTYAVGTVNRRARDMLARVADGVLELAREARIGDGPELAAAAAERYVRERIPADRIWWVGGYSLGLALPPSWVGHTYLANDGLERTTWQDGSVFNYETVLFDRDDGFEAATIDTLLMTDHGLEVLSALPRELLVA
jgi:Xaa-Pro aminopeptidase